MTWRSQTSALVVLAFVAATALLPLAAGDHVYSHRYVVFGRVVDANDDPVPGLAVKLGYEKPFEAEGNCANQPGTATEAFGPTTTNPITNEFGEFMFCTHSHFSSRAEPGGGVLAIESLGIEKRFGFDGFTRSSFIVVKLDDPHPSANKELASTQYTIYGRLWKPSPAPIHVEGIRVYGNTLHDQPVVVNFTYNGKETVSYNASTNNYGDFAIRVPVSEKPTTGNVTVIVGNETFVGDIAPAGVTALTANVENVQDFKPFLITMGIIAGVVVVAVGGFYGIRAMRTSREERSVREASHRKRAKK